MQFTFWEEAAAYDDCSDGADAGTNNALSGIASEHLVMADLLYAGLGCVLSGAMSRFDILVNPLTRVQVKSCKFPRKKHHGATARSFTGYWFGDGAKCPLSDYAADVDVFAFVAGDIRKIIYAPSAGISRRVGIRLDAFSDEACALSRKLAFTQKT